MNALTSHVTGCGSSSCACAADAEAPAPQASVNGVALRAPGQRMDAQALRERAWAELLRQQAV